MLSRHRSAWHRDRTGLACRAVAALLVALLVACGSGSPAPVTPSPLNVPQWGVYAGPGARGVASAGRFATATHMPITRVLDFLPGESWRAMTHSAWLLRGHANSRYHLELSVPMLPRRARGDLADCARGADNASWRRIAAELRSASLGASTIRPGWEFNGDWYPWSVADPSQAASYAACFRQLVTTMRRVSPRLTFTWSVAVGSLRLPAELAWPGDDYVDTVGVDVYDYSTSWYPPPAGVSLDRARQASWLDELDGDHGLRFWSDFATRHGKPLALPEWGLAWRSDGHAGGDNPYFVQQLRTFVRDPAHHVAYATYFNSADSRYLAHDLLGPRTRFPAAAREIPELSLPR